MTLLRRRMTEDMQVRNFSPHTQDGLNSLFELATILCPGHHQRKVECDDAFTAQQFRHPARRSSFLS